MLRQHKICLRQRNFSRRDTRAARLNAILIAINNCLRLSQAQAPITVSTFVNKFRDFTSIISTNNFHNGDIFLSPRARCLSLWLVFARQYATAHRLLLSVSYYSLSACRLRNTARHAFAYRVEYNYITLYLVNKNYIALQLRIFDIDISTVIIAF